MGERIKVVMVDDELDLCNLVKANLEDTDEFEVAITSKAEEAKGMISQFQPDIILLDNVMPNIKGSELAQSLKSDPATRAIPIVIVSGKGEMVYNKKKDQFQWLPGNPMVKKRGEIVDEKNPQKAAEAYGVDDYVSKPFTTELLITVIRDVLKKKKKRTGGEETTETI